MEFHERMTVRDFRDQLVGTKGESELWIIDTEGRATPASAVFREIGNDGVRVYVVSRPWLRVQEHKGIA